MLLAAPAPLLASPAPARRLTPTDSVWAAGVLAAAYAAAGVPAWVAAGWLRYTLRCGRAYANADNTAVALWLGPPGRAVLGWAGQLRAGLLLAPLRHLGWAGARRYWQHSAATERYHRLAAPAGPYHRLLALGVLPAAQGRGVGRRLLLATRAALQASYPAPCYLPPRPGLGPAPLSGFFL